ncbi:RICIN domain-containing protein [Actinoplanes aureus]|uniref:RICIN domain-containing protein n=1 Tax=Actinoplanes aureus TaxID=2792083 RepID=A0A931CG29_9ACTN|nr:RICIN domain-containing protein [Actinoplanes aureus]MBG0566571.1 RICIN domain-containing protein [Actinoplanes aureus]
MSRSRTISMFAAVMATILGVVLAPASPALAYSGPYQIKFEHSGKCLDLYQNKAVDGAKVQQWTCASPSSTNRNHQQWVFEWTSDDGHAQIRKWNTNYCLNGDGNNGGRVYLWNCGTSMVWKGYKMHGGPPDWYQMTGYGRQVCIDMPHSSLADGQQPQLWSCVNSSGNQHLTWYPF